MFYLCCNWFAYVMLHYIVFFLLGRLFSLIIKREDRTVSGFVKITTKEKQFSIVPLELGLILLTGLIITHPIVDCLFRVYEYINTL